MMRDIQGVPEVRFSIGVIEGVEIDNFIKQPVV